MALKAEHKKFISFFVKTGDHIASYLKVFPNSDRKTAATRGKRWLKNEEIAEEIKRLTPKKGENEELCDKQDETSSLLEDAKAKLDAREVRFGQEYLIDLNATAASIRSGYGVKNAAAQGWDLLRKPNIRAYIKLLMAEREKRTEITADKVLYELAQIAFAKITDFLRVETVLVEHNYHPYLPTGDDEEDNIEDNQQEIEKYTQKNVEIFDTDFISPDKISAVASIKQGKNGIELKLHDKPAALGLLGRHLALWNDKLAINPGDELIALYKSVMNASEGAK